VLLGGQQHGQAGGEQAVSQLVPIEQKAVNFNGAEIVAVKASDGKVYVGVRWICAGLELDDNKQRTEFLRISRDPVLCQGVKKLSLPTNGGIQEVVCIDLDFLPLWLAKINVGLVDDPDVLDKLMSYQLHAKDVLAKAFLQSGPVFQIPGTYAEALEEAARLERERQTLARLVALQAPKVEVYDAAMSAKNALTMAQVAKTLGWGRNSLFRELKNRRILMDNTEPYQNQIDCGRFVVRVKPITMGGETVDKTQTLVTPKGLDYLSRLLGAEGRRSA
jgi:phage antirepressor YoqD-like protein